MIPPIWKAVRRNYLHTNTRKYSYLSSVVASSLPRNNNVLVETQKYEMLLATHTIVQITMYLSSQSLAVTIIDIMITESNCLNPFLLQWFLAAKPQGAIYVVMST